MRSLLALLAIAGLAAPLFAASANLVVMSTNPNGVPLAGTQFLLGIQVTGASGPTFLGSNLVTLSGNIGHSDAPGAFAAQPASFYHGPDVLFQSESDLSHSINSAVYKRTSDSYFASTWRTLLTFANGGAGETASSLFIDGGISNAMPAQVPGNGTYPFAYVNVTGSPGVQIHGTFAIGSDPAPIGGGDGLLLTPGGALNGLSLAADFNDSDSVTGADLTIWRGAFGSTAAGDADDDGDSDGFDFLVWQRELGMVISTVNSTAIPEPSYLSLLCAAAAAGVVRRCRGRVHR